MIYNLLSFGVVILIAKKLYNNPDVHQGPQFSFCLGGGSGSSHTLDVSPSSPHVSSSHRHNCKRFRFSLNQELSSDRCSYKGVSFRKNVLVKEFCRSVPTSGPRVIRSSRPQGKGSPGACRFFAFVFCFKGQQSYQRILA